MLNWFRKKKVEKVEIVPLYSLCEAVTATAISLVHIRKLTEAGRKLGGGADTPALCGRNVSWDLGTEINKDHLAYCCTVCVEEYQKQIGE